MKKIATLVSILSVVICACGGGGSGSGDETTHGETVLAPDGTEVTSLGVADPVAASLSHLDANTLYHVDVTGPDGSTVCTNTVYTDANGVIPQSQYCFLRDSNFANDATVDKSVGSFMKSTKAVATGDYSVVVSNSDGDNVLTLTTPVTATAATVCASDSSGNCARSFLQDISNVYVTIEEGTGISEGDSVDIYIVNDRCSSGYTVEDELSDVTGGKHTVTVNFTQGKFTTVESVWPNPVGVGPYDIVVDVDKSGTYTTGDIVEIIDQAGVGGLCATGFTVQLPYSTAKGIVMQLAMNANRAYQDVFNQDPSLPSYSDVYVGAQSYRRLSPHALSTAKYIVAHKNDWSGGEQLVDILDPMVDEVQIGCTNEPRRLIGPIPIIQPGCYDVVYDVNTNGTYDLGDDAVDNIDLNGNNTCGFMVVGETSEFQVTIDEIIDTTQTDVKDGTSTANFSLVKVKGAVTGSEEYVDSVTIYAYAVKGTQQSNLVHVSLGGDGDYSIDGLPLFGGKNTIVVYATQGLGSDMRITQATSSVKWNPAGLVTVNDIQAHVSWTEGSDAAFINVHLVKPGGHYAGSFEADNYSDCYSGNECVFKWCFYDPEVGGDLCGEGVNFGLDWSTLNGSIAPEDVAGGGFVAKLDGGCSECSSNSESVWLNSADTVSPKTGKYLLCVRAVTGMATPSATVSLKGVQMANIMAPASISEDQDQTWYVGYFDWTGGGGSWMTVNKIGADTICAVPAP